MTQVSRNPVNNDVWKRMEDLLLRSVLNAKNKKDLKELLDGLLAPTEETMVIKRLAIAVLLAKNRSYDEIRKTLKVTPNTISKIKFGLDNVDYFKKVVDKIVSDDNTKALLEDIKNVLDLPGKGYDWSKIGKRKFQRKIKARRLSTSV